MGINPGVYLANIFLLWFEISFFQRLLDCNRMDVVLAFLDSKRFIDDILSINNPFFEEFINRSTRQPLGLYPTYLNLNITSGYTPVPFMDLTIAVSRSGRLYSRLYDKLNDVKYSRLPARLYIHNDSFVAESTIRAVVVSQLHRFSRLCMARADFEVAAASFLVRLIRNNISVRMVGRATRALISCRLPCYGQRLVQPFIENITNSIIAKLNLNRRQTAAFKLLFRGIRPRRLESSVARPIHRRRQQ
jgi:hypothetical protein